MVRSATARDVFDNILHWEHYPELAPHVRSATVHSTYPDPECASSWELHFRSGLLRWTERDQFLPEKLEIHFEQTDGDFESFSGTWHLAQQGDDVTVAFAADFDFGIPSLEGILDPIAERVIKETVAWAVTGMFEHTDLFGDISLSAPAMPGLPTTA
ncbi:SRPBCC family protein [Frankia sp. Ag45/Mut15]|uniref:SRPBCC family protein n=2 Tax=Frankia umida TaxID=573489 RepID=A0ABT0K461_9ACTN|nr:SRPBCC family protein [Frankia umida]